MRLRNVRGAFEKLEESTRVIKNPEEYKGKWKELFKNDNPIHIEIGMGKGQFLINHSQLNPNINYIGFEKFTVVLAKALKKIEKEDLPNLQVVRMDVEALEEIFVENEIDCIYLNFSDPWPKEKHEKRRLTHKGFLEKYDYILKTGSHIILKTDNDNLFSYSVNEMSSYGYKLEVITNDLYNSEYQNGNIQTEYEEKFVEEGKNINMVRFRRR